MGRAAPIIFDVEVEVQVDGITNTSSDAIAVFVVQSHVPCAPLMAGGHDCDSVQKLPVVT